MAKPIELSIVGNSRDLVKSTKDVEKALEDLDDSVSDLGKDGAKDVDRLEKKFSELSGEVRDTGKVAKQMGRDFESASDSSTRKASENVREFSGEAKQNLAETLSSFDGTVEGTLAGIQGTLGGVTAGLKGVTPILLAAAGAAGVGAIIQALANASETSEQFKAQVSELTSELLDLGKDGAPAVEYIVDKLKELATTTDESAVSLKDLRSSADKSQSSFKDLAQAYSGNTRDLDALVKKNQEYYDSLNDQADAIDQTTNAGIAQYSAIQQQIVGQEQYNTYLRDAKKVADEAAAAEANYAAAGGAELAAKAELIKTIDSAYDDAAGSVDDFINKETGLFDTGAYIAAMQAREAALDSYQENLATSGLSPEAKSFLNTQGAEAAASFLAGYQAATPAQQAELNRIWTEAGLDNSGTYNAAVESGFQGKTIKGPAVSIEEPDINGIVRNLQYRASQTQIRFPAAVFTRNGEQVY